MAARTGKIILAKGIKLDRTYKNVINYTEANMVTLVTNNKVAEYSDCSFVRQGDNRVDVPCPYMNAIKCNYLAFQNPDYSNKWFFAFIDEIEYRSNGMTRITFTIDEYSTWRDYWNTGKCFVIREHVTDDTVGANTVPEGLETGDYDIVDLRYASMYESGTASLDFNICFCVTKLPENNMTNLGENGRVMYDLGYIGGVFSSLKFFAVETWGAAETVIRAYETDPVSTDAIINVYMVPTCCVNKEHSTHTLWSSDGKVAVMYPLYNYYVSDSYKLQQPQVLAENYSPVNKKLLTFPYSYFFVTNNVGETVDFKYEDFPFETIGDYTRRTISYKKYLVPTASVSGKLIFDNYKSYSSTSDYPTKLVSYGITYGKVPVCAWTTDYYTNWLTQNGVNIALDLLKAGTSIAVGAAVGAATGGIGAAAAGAATISAVNTVLGSVQQVEQASFVPPQSHGDTNTGDFAFAFSRNIISFYEMSIRPEFARIIDNYFSLRGYKVNVTKIPNENTRTYWNYVQIGGEEIVCYPKDTFSIPTKSVDIINNIYRNGVTIWHNHDNIGNYSLDNSI